MSNKNKIYHWTSTFKSLGETDDGGVNIKGAASTNALDRAGDIIQPDAWTKGGLESYKGNPIILFNHDYNKPIGRATDLSVTDNGLDISAKISKAAGDITQLVKDGGLGAFSVGFRCKDSEYMTETDGYKMWHCEHGPFDISSRRIIAWMFYLNNAKSGTEFMHFSNVRAKRGRCVIWPSFWTHLHKGVTPNKGLKYIITGWASFIPSTIN